MRGEQIDAIVFGLRGGKVVTVRRGDPAFQEFAEGWKRALEDALPTLEQFVRDLMAWFYGQVGISVLERYERLVRDLVKAFVRNLRNLMLRVLGDQAKKLVTMVFVKEGKYAIFISEDRVRVKGNPPGDLTDESILRGLQMFLRLAKKTL